MAQSRRDATKRDRQQRPRPRDGQINAPEIEMDPAVERGERIQTGKTIHRGGKTTGHVPGATEQKPAQK